MLSGFFLVLQIIVLLEFTFVANEWLLERGDHWAAKVALVVGGSTTRSAKGLLNLQCAMNATLPLQLQHCTCNPASFAQILVCLLHHLICA